MGGHLAKTPLLAFIYASVLHFIAVFIPYSAAYSGVVSGFSMPLNGYFYTIVYGFYISLILAVAFVFAKSKGFKLMLFLLLPVLFTQFVVPMLQQLMYGETTGVMTTFDSLMELLKNAAAVIFIMLLAVLLFKTAEEPKPPVKAPPKPQVTYHIKKLDLSIKMLVLPVIFCVIYFLVWYFLLWRFEEVRVYYSSSPELKSFIAEIVNMLLTNAKLVPMALLKGLLLALCMLPLLKELEANRAMYISVTVLLFLGTAVRMLIPSPVMPSGVRMAHLLELSVDAVIYGALTGFLTHISLLRKVPQVVVAAASAKNRKPVKQPEAQDAAGKATPGDKLKEAQKEAAK